MTTRDAFMDYLMTAPKPVEIARAAARVPSAEYYIAYGSNLNLRQMQFRCPKAKPVMAVELQGWELVFRYYCDIEPREGSTVPVGIFQITADCERALDRYEGFPRLYRKEYIDLPIGRALVYTMNSVNETGRDYQKPDRHYEQTVRQGYADFELKTVALNDALANV